MKHLQATWANC